jgi:hypothetical protein
VNRASGTANPLSAGKSVGCPKCGHGSSIKSPAPVVEILFGAGSLSQPQLGKQLGDEITIRRFVRFQAGETAA